MIKVLENYRMDVKEKLDKIKSIEAQAIEIIKKARAESQLAITKAEEEAASQAKIAKEKAAAQVDQDRLWAKKQIEKKLHGIETVNEKARKKLSIERAGAVDLAAVEIANRIKQGLAG